MEVPRALDSRPHPNHNPPHTAFMSQSTLPTLDDTLLRRIAAEPPRTVFPVLQRAEAMVPLVVVLAALPTLYAVAHRTLTETGAHQGLLSLQCLQAETLNEFVDPVSAGAESPLAYQPLLMNWLTVLGLKLFGVGSTAGQVAAAYLCTVGLIAATYVLARRVGGERLGLIAAGLIAFNPHVLRLAQEPAPQSAAVMLAVLAMAGAVAHWQKSSSTASWQLLVGGIALGLCLLAGGSVALAVAAVLLIYVLCWKLDGWLRAPPPGVLDRESSVRRRALRGVLILAATGFAVGGWRSLLMGSRYGTVFWSNWLWFSGIDPAVAPETGGWGWAAWVARWSSLVLPLSVLALAGGAVVVVDMAKTSVSSGRRHQGLLVVWLFLAAILWSRLGVVPSAAGGNADFWAILLIVPLTLLASIAILALIDRKLTFPIAIGIGLATALDLLIVGYARARTVDEVGTGGHDARQWMLGLTLATLAASALWLAWRPLSRETRRWGYLSGFVLFLFAVNCLWGGMEVRRESPGDRELDELRQVLSRFSSVRRWTLVAPATTESIKPAPPAELTYTLHCLWPGANAAQADSWESLAVGLEAERSAPTGQKTEPRLVVCWCCRPNARAAAPVGLLKSVSPPGVFRSHEVSVYHPAESTP